MEILKDMPVRIAALTSGRVISQAKYSEWLEAERTYLESKKSEPEADVLGVEYVELLDKYETARYRTVINAGIIHRQTNYLCGQKIMGGLAEVDDRNVPS